MSKLLEVEGLEVEFYSFRPERSFKALCSVNFEIAPGEIVGLVGESGCGKSLTARALVSLLPETASADGKIYYRDQTLQAGDSAQRRLRGREIGLVFQEPMSSLNPVFTVGAQLKETLSCLRNRQSRAELEEQCIRLLKQVQLKNPGQKLNQYPHQLSGGQQQRVVIALALAGEPGLLVADEPTTALDAPLRREIIKLFGELAGQGLSVLLISHNLALVREVCERVVVMYSGYTVENCELGCGDLIARHPYTAGLKKTSEALFSANSSRLPVIEGEVPEPAERPAGCPFHPRCAEVTAECRRQFPPVSGYGNEKVFCWARGD